MTTRYEGSSTYQTVLEDKVTTEKEEISIEIVNGKAELMVSAVDKHNDEHFAYAHLSYDQLWEHIHNCLNALNSMGKKSQK